MAITNIPRERPSPYDPDDSLQLLRVLHARHRWRTSRRTGPATKK